MINKSFEELLQDYLANRLSPEEVPVFRGMLMQKENAQILERYADSLLDLGLSGDPAIKQKADVIFNRVVDAGKMAEQQTAVVYMEQKTTRRYFVRVAAAAIVILFCTGTYMYLRKPAENRQLVKQGPASIVKETVSVQPGSNKAILVLADGTAISLDDEKNGELSQQGSAKVIKIDGKLSYDKIVAGEQPVVYNTISTPRGGQYQITLADGTLVWLNAASSLRFPTAFTGKERRVEITGEAYFEVAKNKQQPFTVTAGSSQVQVLGTHFNVMAYDDEADLTTTLLEGSVKFVSGTSSGMLVPGQQSRLSKTGKLKLVDNVDVNAVVAWKNGFFHFENADMQTVLHQLSRWYDVDLVYADANYQYKKTNDLLQADIPRNTSLADVLKVLDMAGGGKFSVDGKKILIGK